MGEMSAKPKATMSNAVLRRRRTVVAAFRRDRRSEPAPSVPDWGRIVLRSASTTLR
jgi:hypothetical protein